MAKKSGSNNIVDFIKKYFIWLLILLLIGGLVTYSQLNAPPCIPKRHAGQLYPCYYTSDQ
ncbi:Uncharacterised protein [uncultured archaeon]|nr:Uncharacterised protein [uncultured archaeon]